jgi:hypothetical protein
MCLSASDANRLYGVHADSFHARPAPPEANMEKTAVTCPDQGGVCGLIPSSFDQFLKAETPFPEPGLPDPCRHLL